jgi:hypothetical protein
MTVHAPSAVSSDYRPTTVGDPRVAIDLPGWLLAEVLNRKDDV